MSGLPGSTPLGFGAAQLGNLYRVTTDAEAANAVEAAWEGGIRHFDTAPHYGLGTSERRLGALLAPYPRDEYVLSTKVGRLLRPVGPADGAASGSTASGSAAPGCTAEIGDDSANGFAVPADHERIWDMSERGVRTSHAQSLERLGLDRVDILYVHDPEEGPTEQAFAEALPALARMRAEGLVREIGVGSKDASVLRRAVLTGLVDRVMLSGRHTLLEQESARDLLRSCRERGVHVVAVSVFNSGLLARPDVPDDALYEYDTAPPVMIARARALADLARRHGLELPDLAVQFPLRESAVDAVVLGMRTGEQVRQNLARMARDIPEQAWREVANHSAVGPADAP